MQNGKKTLFLYNCITYRCRIKLALIKRVNKSLLQCIYSVLQCFVYLIQRPVTLSIVNQSTIQLINRSIDRSINLILFYWIYRLGYKRLIHAKIKFIGYKINPKNYTTNPRKVITMHKRNLI